MTWNFHQKQRIKDKQSTLLLVLPSFDLMYHFDCTLLQLN
ncbi:hypothetical protein GXM_06422 [Nostoc sphaeroides CCNUC1]|uniref:Uncharacterized protein n=1 Tax=Nostoc sphaeroides CCNUC1 TaxID=2653204 RepID=A0A5P8W878_9NOSO|nr:hypothetical protein GXM_06422 [Nostoc sphaeroides CCNUC1]